MPLDLFGDLFELCLDLNPKSGTEGPNGISITHHQDQDQSGPGPWFQVHEMTNSAAGSQRSHWSADRALIALVASGLINRLQKPSKNIDFHLIWLCPQK